METIELKLTADLFKDTHYTSNDCPIGRSATKAFPANNIDVALGGIYVGKNSEYMNNKYIQFESSYYYSDFQADERKAWNKLFSPNEIIRVIKLIPVNHGQDNTQTNS